MREQQQPAFQTDHLYLAAFLVCSGQEITGTSSIGSRVSFEFAQTPELSAEVANFMSGALVPARKFSFEVLKLKRLIPRHMQTMKRDYKHGYDETSR